MLLKYLRLKQKIVLQYLLVIPYNRLLPNVDKKYLFKILYNNK